MLEVSKRGDGSVEGRKEGQVGEGDVVYKDEEYLGS